MIAEFEGQYAFLSNFFPSPIIYEGITYPTNEHFFQAMKTLDQEERRAIAAAGTPGKAKRMGRQVSLRNDWEQVKVDVLEEANPGMDPSGEIQISLNEPRDYSDDKKELTFLDKLTILFMHIQYHGEYSNVKKNRKTEFDIKTKK